MPLDPNHARALLENQKALESLLLRDIQAFERATGMRVHAIKIFRGSADSPEGRLIKDVEVSAMLR